MEDNDSMRKSKNNNIICFGCDLGTMNIILARSDSKDIKITRNVFLPLKDDEVSITELSDISYVKGEDCIYVIGEDAFRLSNMFAHKVSRPMESGLISQKEIDAIDVISPSLDGLTQDVSDVVQFPNRNVDTVADVVNCVATRPPLLAVGTLNPDVVI